MDLNTSAQEASGVREQNDFGVHDAGEYSYGKSSHAFRTISEVSDEIDVPQHVLRFWESKFAQIRPLKRGGGRRYYRPEDIELLKRIKNYLYKQGYTIKGVQRLLKEKRSEAISNFAPFANPAASLPGYPFEQVLQQVAPLSISSYLQAAAAAPSALAMAYGAIGGQIAEHAGRQHFGDAFEQSTIKVDEEQIAADQASNDQIEKTLAVVTQIHSELVTPVQPIRIANPAAPSLEDMAQDMVEAASAALAEKAAAEKTARELEFNFENPAPKPVDFLALPQVITSAAQPAIEAFEEEEFNQDVVDEDGPVKRLDDATNDTADVVEAIEVQLGAFEEIMFDVVPAARAEEPIVIQLAPEPTPHIAPEKKEQLLGVLAEMMALRDMLRVEIVA